MQGGIFGPPPMPRHSDLVGRECARERWSVAMWMRQVSVGHGVRGLRFVAGLAGFPSVTGNIRISRRLLTSEGRQHGSRSRVQRRVRRRRT